ncbi:MAG: hypothetical protein ABI700_07370 [Chloroflexota bacterium]
MAVTTKRDRSGSDCLIWLERVGQIRAGNTFQRTAAATADVAEGATGWLTAVILARQDHGTRTPRTR